MKHCLAVVLMLGLLQTSSSLAQDYEVKAEVTGLNNEKAPFGPHQVVRINLNYLEAGTDDPAEKLLQPRAWFRVRQEGDLQCSTSVNIEYGRSSVSVVGYLIASLNRDNTLTFVDPLVKLASANILSNTSLPEKPLAVHSYAGEVLLLLPKTAVIMAVSPSGATRLLATGLSAATAMTPVGAVIAVADGSSIQVLNEAGKSMTSLQLPTAIHSLYAAETIDGEAQTKPHLMAVGTDNTLYGVDVDTGRIIWTQKTPAAINPDTSTFTNNTVTLTPRQTGTGLDLRYWNSPNRAIPIQTDFVVQGIVLSKTKPFAFAWSNTEKKAALIDTRIPKIVEAINLDRPVAQALFSGWNLFLSHERHADLTVIDTGPLARGEASSRLTLPIEVQQQGTTHMSNFADDGQILALLHTGNEVRTYGNGQSTAPKTITALKGSPSTQTFILDRRFKSTGEGNYSVIARLPANGPVQLVTSSGLGGTQSCFDISSTAPPLATPASMELLDANLTSGKPMRKLFQFKGDLPVKIRTSDSLLMQAELISLKFRWRKKFIAMRKSDGVYEVEMNLPINGQYSFMLPDFSSVSPLRVSAQ